MPSLEIICIGQQETSDFSHLPFLVESETNLVSHRGPTPLFQSDFDQIKGCIYHLLDDRKVTAFDLMKRDWYNEDGNSNGLDDNVEFLSEYAPALREMLGQLLRSSPVKKILFTTDYQFGSGDAERFGAISFEKFWQMHDAGKLRMNSSYEVGAS